MKLLKLSLDNTFRYEVLYTLCLSGIYNLSFTALLCTVLDESQAQKGEKKRLHMHSLQIRNKNMHTQQPVVYHSWNLS